METTSASRRREILLGFRAAFPATMPVLTGFLVLGLAYGVLMQTKGYGPLWSGLMSAVAFCGGMQFVAISALLTTAFHPFQAILLSFMVNARHIFYGLSLLEKYKGLGWRRYFCIYTLCDENFSLTSTLEPPEGVLAKDFYFALSLLNWSYWTIASVLGGLLGNLLTFNTAGLDFALTALFVVLFLEQVRKKENRAAGAIGIAATVVSLVCFGADNLVIPAMVLILVLALLGQHKLGGNRT